MTEKLTLTHARLLDGSGDAPLADATVLLAGETIAAIYPAGQAVPETDGRVLDLGGRTLLPGLINAHIHILMEDQNGDSFALMQRRVGGGVDDPGRGARAADAGSGHHHGARSGRL